MPAYVWLCLNMRMACEYSKICVNGFCFTFHHCQPFPIETRDYLFQHLHKTKSYGLKEHKAVFLKIQNMISSIGIGHISCVSFFRLCISTSKISNLQLLLGTNNKRGRGGVNLNVTLIKYISS